ncbi:hypothetical protein [Catellatospora chokoriensis]|uniref:PH domain-containing protein n=1 Tax=Catellatospora chokoriensis TaxID=310353 RepID=A0A8J3NR84_9ACTN|nr:hypothetical protein [Catellatospora chokoriensis]GIF89098.1 hypothetical protein Cch02nite_25420 [Catellatospora chokoriensis]
MSRLPRTFRNRAYPVLGWTFLFLGPGFLACAWAVVGKADGAFLFVPSTIVIVLFCWRGYIRPRLVAGVEDVTVVRIWKTSVVPWLDIERFEAGHLLVVVRRPELGGPIGVWAVQAANLARMTGRRSQADDVADELNALLRVARANGGKAG